MSLVAAHLPLVPEAPARAPRARVWRPFPREVADIIGVERLWRGGPASSVPLVRHQLGAVAGGGDCRSETKWEKLRRNYGRWADRQSPTTAKSLPGLIAPPGLEPKATGGEPGLS